MSLCKGLTTILFTILFLGLAYSQQYSQQVLAQSPVGAEAVSQSEKDDETNLDTQLYLLVASNQAVDDAKMPAALDPLVKQLRSSLPFKNYKLAATLINRVKNNGRLNLKWVGGPRREDPDSDRHSTGFKLTSNSADHKLRSHWTNHRYQHA